MPTVLGAHSPRLDAVRKLQTKSGRREAQRFVVEGPTMLAEALAAGCRPEAIYVTELTLPSLPAAAGESGLPIFVVPERAMARLSDLETPPGVLCELPMGLHEPGAALAPGEPALLLAGVSDPGNAGTLLRSAEIFGIRTAIFAKGGVEPHNSKVVRATMGALFRMRLAVAGSAEIARAATHHGYEIVAATREGTPLPLFSFPARPLIAIGSERHGLAEWLPTCNSMVAVPQTGGGESLNAAVAGSIIFYAFSQRLNGSNDVLQNRKKP